MGYVHPDKPDIFLSYAHVNNEPDPAFPDRTGWVTTLVRGLKARLANKLGRVDSYDLWSDAKLAGNVEVTPEILGKLSGAAVILLVLSPAYLASEWCRRELTAFHEEIRRRKAGGGRVFIVEFDRVNPGEKPPELSALKGYRFWIEDPDNGNPETLGYPIVREKDLEEYYKRLNDLCIELVRELETLRQGQPAAPVSVTAPGAVARPAIYLAEVTEDLETRRDDVRRYLDQAGFRILPEGDLSRDDREAYRVQVDAELARSLVFVQLLSETPGRRFKRDDISYVAVQHERALALKKEVLQWRRRELDIASGEIPEDHRWRLSGTTVVAADLSEFKTWIVETVKKLTSPTPAALVQRAPGDPDKLVFVDAEETDLEAARAIIAFFSAKGVGTLPPVRGTSPEAIRTALKTRMLTCDGIVLVLGTNADWPVLQWNHFRKVKAEREVAIRAVGLCDLPPPDKPMKAMDVLQIPSVLVIDCCDGLAAEKFATFLEHL
jgi:hypothetical protein